MQSSSPYSTCVLCRSSTTPGHQWMARSLLARCIAQPLAIRVSSPLQLLVEILRLMLIRLVNRQTGALGLTCSVVWLAVVLLTERQLPQPTHAPTVYNPTYGSACLPLALCSGSTTPLHSRTQLSRCPRTSFAPCGRCLLGLGSCNSHMATIQCDRSDACTATARGGRPTAGAALRRYC